MFHAFLALLAGAVLPVQTGVNSSLRAAIGHPIWAAAISFSVGLLTLLVLALGLRLGAPNLNNAPFWAYVGGSLGVVYVALSIVLAPKLGAVALVSLAIAGQLLASVVLDHFGWLGFAQLSLNPGRMLGVAFLALGVYFVKAF